VTPPSRSGDDGWSRPSYAGSKPADPPRGVRAPARSGDDGWGEPSYSRDEAARRERTRQPERQPERRAELPRQSPPPRRAERQAPERTAVQNRVAPVTPRERPRSDDLPPARGDDGWTPAGPVPARDQRAARAAERRAQQEAQRTQRSIERLTGRGGAQAGYDDAPAAPRPYERGQVWWVALLVLIAITVLGAVIDSIASIGSDDGFNYGIVIASIAAILLVKRSNMFPVVVAPPIVYSVVAMVQLYLKSSLSNDKHGLINTVLDAVQNYLVYGFPALASATAAVLIIAGIRLVARK
jgi:hypothetical protein